LPMGAGGAGQVGELCFSGARRHVPCASMYLLGEFDVGRAVCRPGCVSSVVSRGAAIG
jgi:hypothetical protein